jgi:uncharacterized protein YqjF (DUF2071 family)
MKIPTMAQRLAERERPEGAPVMRQRWARLLFLHWAWDAGEIQRTLPPGLTVDLHEGRAWLGVVPFFMERVRPRGLPAVPGLSNFLELNVRTYVHDAQGRPGVWFYSLDANQWLAVVIARALFHLPYQHAAMGATVSAGAGAVEFRSQRAGTDRESRFDYGLPGDAMAGEAKAGTLEFFLVERYRLFAWDARGGQLFSGRVHHAPYRIAAAPDATWEDAAMGLAGFDAEGREPEHRCVARAVDVEIWPLRRVAERVRRDAEAGEGLGIGAPA